MRIVDLAHPLMVGMPVYPGDQAPTFEVSSTLVETGYVTRRIDLSSHTGTHMDAPAHMISTGRTLDAYPVDHFIGSAVLLDLILQAGSMIEASSLLPHEGRIAECDYLLLNTGWHHHWGHTCYFANYPVLSVDASLWLAGLGLKGIGVDTVSVDAFDAVTYAVHHAFLQRDMIIIENLTNLSALPSDSFTFAAFPLHITDADGSPVRAVAMLD